VDSGPNQSKGRSPGVKLNHGAFGFVIVDRLVCELAQGAELQQQRADLSRIAHCSARFSCLKIYVHVGHSGGRIEDWKQAVAQIIGQIKQALITGELITAEQAAEKTNRNFKIFDFNVLIER